MPNSPAPVESDNRLSTDLESISLRARIHEYAAEKDRFEQVLQRLQDEFAASRQEAGALRVAAADSLALAAAHEDRAEGFLADLAKLRDELRERQDLIAELTQELQRLKSSLSWKATAPLRAVIERLR